MDRPNLKDTIALEKFRTPPNTVGDLRSLLGFFGYYRNYVPNFSKRFQPIYELLKTPPSTGRGKGAGRKSKHSKTVIEWKESMQVVVDETIDYLKSPACLSFPDFSLPFTLNCDASEKGLGAVLYQKQDGVNKIISFASRTLSAPEKNYHMHSGKLEFLCLKWAVTEKFADYLGWGVPFQVYTDNNPLTYVMTTAKLNATGLRWVGELANFNFTIHYKPGKANGDADGLSRNPMDLSDVEAACTMRFDPANLSVPCQVRPVSESQTDNVDLNAVEQACDRSISAKDVSSIMAVRLQSLPPVAAAVDVGILQLDADADSSLKEIPRSELAEHQAEDEVVGPLYQCVKEGVRPSKKDRKNWPPKAKVMLRQFKQLAIEDELLVRKTKKLKQLVMPSQYHNLILRELHDKLGHLGPEKVEELIRQRFYWPCMAADVDVYIHQKCACVARKRPNRQQCAPLVPVMSSAPFELVCVDLMELDKIPGARYVLMVTDHFTRFTQAYPTPNKTAKTVAQKLFSEYIPKFGFPGRFHHDQGREFSNSLAKELHRLTGVQKSQTTPYHPMGNGKVERMNRTMRNMLTSLPDHQKKNWKAQLAPLTFAYNSTINKATGYAPFFLVFGRNSRLPIDCVLPLEPEKTTCKSYDQFVRDWKESMKTAFQLAYQNSGQAAAANKRRYDAKVNTASIGVGDHVLVRNLSERDGAWKLRSWWEQKLYVVVSVRDLVPVFTVRPIDSRKTRTVHRNMLLRVNDMPLDAFGQIPVPSQTPAVRRRAPKGRSQRKTKSDAGDVVSHVTLNSSDSSSDELFLLSRRPLAQVIAPSNEMVGDESSDSDVLTDEGILEFDAGDRSTDDDDPAPDVEPDAHLDNLSTSSNSEIPSVNLPLPHLEDSGGSGEFSSRMEVSPLDDSDVSGASDGEDESNEDEDERTLAAPGSSEDESVMGEVDPGPGLSPVESGASDYVTGENGSQTSEYATPEEETRH